MKKSFLTFLLMLFCLAGFAQQTVTGVILEEATSEPLAGAAVQVKDSQNGTIADADGRFSISVSPGQTLLISYIGLIPQEILVKEGMKDLTIKMLSDAVDINEVVVVGYGVQKKVNLTGSVSSVKGDVLERRPVADAVQSLQGMVPGLLVSNSDGGRPGGTGTLTLRGQGNLDNNAAPYVLVDGVEMSLTDVNPSDIENISVLKDAAACAIYGARAAYGVILVTTKKGEEGKMRINYQGTVGWSTPTVLPDMVNSYDFAQYWNAGVTNAGSPRLYSDEKLALLQQYINDPSSVDPWFELPANSNMNPAFENSESGVGNVNYFDLHYKNWAFKQNHNISLSGGGKAAQYYISGGYYSEDGILRYADMDYKRYNFAANVTSQLTSWMKLKVNTKFMHSDQNTPFGDGGISEGFYHSLARFRPTVSPVDPNGHFTELTMIPYLQSGTYTNTQRDNMNITAGLDIQPVKNWFIFFDYTYKLGNKEYEALNVSPLIYGADGVSTSKGVRSELGMSPDGKFTRSYDRTRYQSINLYTNYLFSLAEKHNFTVMAGFQEEDYNYSLMKNSITGLYSTSNPNVGMGTGDKTVIDTRNGWATRGFFGRINYSLKDRYLLEANLRYDGSSRFADGHRWGIFPSVSAGWRISEEDFWKNSSVSNIFDNLKVRASYGVLGNQNIGVYPYQQTYSLGQDYPFGNPAALQPGAAAGTYNNPEITWEKTAITDIGLDFSLFNGRFTGTLDYFYKYTSDILAPVEVSSIMGRGVGQSNIGAVSNKGIEVNLTYNGQIGRNFRFSISPNFTWVKNAVEKLANGATEEINNNRIVGQPIGIIYGYETDGLFVDQAEIDAAPEQLVGKSSLKPGYVKYKDISGPDGVPDGKVDAQYDRTVLGSTTPKFYYGLNLSASYKGLDFSALLQGLGGHKRLIGSYMAYAFYNGGQIQRWQADNCWTEANPNKWAEYPRLETLNMNNTNLQTSDYWVRNASFLRVKNVQIGYTFPKTWTKKIGMENVRVYVSGQNLLSFNSFYKGWDPENEIATGDGPSYYPINSIYSFGFNIKF